MLEGDELDKMVGDGQACRVRPRLASQDRAYQDTVLISKAWAHPARRPVTHYLVEPVAYGACWRCALGLSVARVVQSLSSGGSRGALRRRGTLSSCGGRSHLLGDGDVFLRPQAAKLQETTEIT